MRDISPESPEARRKRLASMRAAFGTEVEEKLKPRVNAWEVVKRVALGVYSDVQGNTGNFLRGFQRTDANGKATFQTIYPGWYQGRAVHIHFKIRTDPDEGAGFEFTSQLFFDDDLSRSVFSTGVYAQKGAQDMPNAQDGIYNQSGGATLLSVTKEGDAYKASFPIAVQLT